MLTTEKRNQIADLITEQAAKTIREQVEIDWPDDDFEDVIAIERQVAVQLLTGLRSAPLTTDTPGRYNAPTLYQAVFALLGQSSVETDNEGQVLFYSGLAESERLPNGHPRFLETIDQA